MKITSNINSNKIALSQKSSANNYFNLFPSEDKKTKFLKDVRIKMQLEDMRETYKYLSEGIENIEYGLRDLFYLDQKVKEVAAEMGIDLKTAWEYLSEKERIQSVMQESQKLQNICHQIPKIA